MASNQVQLPELLGLFEVAPQVGRTGNPWASRLDVNAGGMINRLQAVFFRWLFPAVLAAFVWPG